MPQHDRGRLRTADQLVKFHPGLTKSQLKRWEQTKGLKAFTHTGERQYYENQVKALIEGREVESNDGINPDALRTLQQRLRGDGPRRN